MRRRMAALLVVGIGLFVGSGAGAQTTTTTSSTSSTTSSSTTSSTAVVPTTPPPTTTTSTTIVNPCTGQPCTVDPPVATLSGSGGDVPLNMTSACWRAPVFGAEGPVARCLAATLAPFESIPVGLVVRNGETLTLRFAIGMAPTEVVLQRGEASTPLTPANPTTFVANLPVGVYLISFNTKWNQGNASYFLKVDVRAAAGPASPTRGTIALTG